MDNQHMQNLPNIQKPSAAFIGASWAALGVGVIAFLIGLYNAEMQLNEKGYYFTVLMFGLFASISLQKSVRDRAENIPDEQPWAVAQSVFPISALKGSARRLRHLGKTPLGYVLFGRHKPVCQRVISDTQLYGQTCFTRQNYYYWHGHDILVQETFLPAFLKRISP